MVGNHGFPNSNGMGDDSALEVALALMRSPPMRNSLRLRPLPEDISDVIELAARIPGRIETAAHRSGESPEYVLEAARFYVREMMLFSGADAYRVLGVSPDAHAEQIKSHYRHLQHWLHPDRRGDDWESIFSTRINAAWSELRSPARRAAYDDMRAKAAPNGIVTLTSIRSTAVGWQPMALSTSTRWRNWILLAAATAACLWLMMLTERRARLPAPDWNSSIGQHDQAKSGLQAATGSAVPAQAKERAMSSGDQPHAIHVQPHESIPFPAESVPALLATQPIGNTDVATMQWQASKPAQSPSGKNASNLQQVECLTGEPRVCLHPLPTNPDNPALLEAEHSEIDLLPQPADRTLEAPAAFSGNQDGDSPSSIMQADEVPLERVQLAHHLGLELTRYLASDTSHVPPIWHSVSVQDAAALLRDRLTAQAANTKGTVQFGNANWRITANQATMTTKIRSREQTIRDHSLLRAQMTWHQGMWLVNQLEVEALP